MELLVGMFRELLQLWLWGCFQVAEDRRLGLYICHWLLFFVVSDGFAPMLDPAFRTSCYGAATNSFVPAAVKELWGCCFLFACCSLLFSSLVT